MAQVIKKPLVATASHPSLATACNALVRRFRPATALLHVLASCPQRTPWHIAPLSYAISRGVSAQKAFSNCSVARQPHTRPAVCREASCGFLPPLGRAENENRIHKHILA